MWAEFRGPVTSNRCTVLIDPSGLRGKGNDKGTSVVLGMGSRVKDPTPDKAGCGPFEALFAAGSSLIAAEAILYGGQAALALGGAAAVLGGGVALLGIGAIGLVGWWVLSDCPKQI
jgi:hypothetical protein